MKRFSFLFSSILVLCLFSIDFDTYAQCSALRPQIDISFNTDQDCAPVTVTQFQITYFFNTAQNPNTIAIEYDWNDPANTFTLINIGNGLVASAGNTAFTANATFTYNDNNGQCNIIPTTSVYINGVLCPTSSQTQSAFFWGTDEQANANLSIAPATWDVCFDNPIVNATFTDNSEFNCNIAVEADNPNRLQRHVQFVYGTNHNPAATIRNLTLNDGAVQGLTDGGGNLVSSTTRGALLPITAGYFGPIDAIPFPADGPVSVTFPMNAPANVANLVGNVFEVTLFNWNICNPWNGNTLNPNYEDAILTRAYIRIVDAPQPFFITTDSGGTPKSTFCINETIFFDNQTTGGGFNYLWEFFDDNTGTTLLSTSNQFEPTVAYSSGGSKLIRVTAINPTAQGACSETYETTITITPTLVATIAVTDLLNNPITPDFCQEAVAPFTNFNIRFADVSTGIANAGTRWRWEFYDPSNVLFRQEPAVGGFSTTVLGPLTQIFITKGVYRIRLIIRDNVTSCETVDEVLVRVFENPVPDFTFTTVCEGVATDFVDASTLNTISGGTITLREWDLNFDGVIFTPNALFTNQTNFAEAFPAGSRQVALRVVSSQGCEDVIVKTVTVNPQPIALFTPDVLSGCSRLTVNFLNQSILGQPDAIDRFQWEVDDGTGFVVDSVQRITDPGFSATFTRVFSNTTLVDKLFNVRLRVITVNNCERLSAPITITVNPSPGSGFVALNYSPFNDNCSPQTVQFQVDALTQALNPIDYRWTVRDVSGVLDDVSTGTIPNYNFLFVNSTQALRDYQITLTTTLPAGGCTGDSTQIIRISPVPISSFIIDTLLFDCERMRIRATALQAGLASYTWTVLVGGIPVFNQTTTDNFLERDINRVIGTDQNIEIRLQTTNFANCQSVVTAQFFSVPQAALINTSFTATPLLQTLPSATVQITNTTNVGTWTYAWNFDDGTTSTQSNPADHTYATYGTYRILLTVTNGVCVEQDSVTVVINPIPPILEFDYFPPNGCEPLEVTFTNLSQFADEQSYVWDFGDGRTEVGIASPIHTYVFPGVYSVSLSATNVLGDTVTILKQQIIEVYQNPTALFDVKPSVLYIPLDKLSTKNVSTNATSFTWDFGDGTTSTEFEPKHTYTDEGVFSISLVAETIEGCRDTLQIPAAVRVIESGELLIPNAFSPDVNGPGGVGKNDVFIPLFRNVISFQMWVFNRWGELLFETTDTSRGWDGYYKGKLCQQDVYVYKIKAVLEDGRTIVKTGDIHLMQ
jgi:gliding motility-associated-like protein